jgi:hypothetical protein
VITQSFNSGELLTQAKQMHWENKSDSIIIDAFQLHFQISYNLVITGQLPIIQIYLIQKLNQ